MNRSVIKNTHRALVFVSLLMVVLNINAQTEDQTPLSPQIAAFQQYGDINVSLSTGVPNISVPLFEINHFGFKIPVSLDYFPTTLRPGYNYDVTGVGWNLSLRSHISRKVNYLPDEEVDFEVYTLEATYNASYSLGLLSTRNFASDVFKATLPDGSSFEFSIISENNSSPEVIIFNGRPLKVSWTTSTFVRPGIISIEVIDESGIEYTFAQPNFDTRDESYHTEWHLSSIKLPNVSQPITFSYGNFIQIAHYYPTFGYSCKEDFLPGDGTLFGEHFYTENPHLYSDPYKHNDLLLTDINYGYGTISFEYDNPNPGNINHNINFYNYLKQISLDAMYEDLIIAFDKTISTVQNVPHAQLEGIEFKKSDGSVFKEYQFINESFYIRNTRTDHWGFYNGGYGESGVSNFVFSATGLPPTLPHYVTKIEDATFGNNSQFAKYQFNAGKGNELFTPGSPGGNHGLLNTIIYPSGGKTIFDFERHKFLTQTSWDGVFIEDLKKRRVAEASGFRIRTITNFDADNIEVGKKNYRYGKRASEIWDPSDMGNSNIVDDFMVGANPEKHTNVGEVVVDPTLANFLTYSCYFPIFHEVGEEVIYYPDEFRDIILGKTEYFSGLRSTYGSSFQWEFNITSKNFQKLLNGRPQVVYPYVTVYEGNYQDNNPASTAGINGKTEYVYDLMDDNGDGSESFMESILNDWGNFNYYYPQSHRYNNLLEKRDFAVNSSQYDVVRKEVTSWSECSSNGVLAFKDFQPLLPVSQLSHIITSGKQQDFIYDYISEGIRLNPEDYYVMKPGQKYVTSYFDDGSEITTREEWSYNTSGRLRTAYTINSDGKENRVYYYYPSNNTEDDYNFSTLLDKNILNVPVDVRTYKDNLLVSGTQTKYNANGQPTDIYVAEPNGTDIPFSSSTPYTFEHKATYSYDDHAIVEITPEDDYSTVYLWDTSKNYVMAKIENITYSTVSSFGAFSLDASFDSETLFNEIKTLVGDNVNITTYSYKEIATAPSQITDPKGLTTTYEYDDFNRLKHIKDHNGDILEAYEYNYRTE